MSIRMGEYECEGPDTDVTQEPDGGGASAILGLRGDGRCLVLDTGEPVTVKPCSENHDRKNSWAAFFLSVLHVAVLCALFLQQPSRRAVRRNSSVMTHPAARGNRGAQSEIRCACAAGISIGRGA
jgi:hypothetical protein